MSTRIALFKNHKRTRCLDYSKQAVVWMVILIMTMGCSGSSRPLHPSYDELKQRGFYVYILPEREIERRKWSKTISLWSWDRHCRGIGAETFNPISIPYQGPEGITEFEIEIDPWDVVWDYNQPTTKVKLATPWAANGLAVYYTEEGQDYRNYIYLRFEDRFGIPVRVTTYLPITEVVSLIDQFEYVGPLPELVTNPWDYSKCPK